MLWSPPPDVSERKILVTETIFDQNDLKQFYIFRLGLPMGPGYRQVISYNAFFHGASRKTKYRNWTNKRLFYATVIGVDPIPPYAIIEPLELPDIYSFFDVIGYDYKHQRYANGETLKPLPRTPE